MTTVNVNSVTINSTSYQGYGPFKGKTSINSVDLGYAPWTNNSMFQAFYGCGNLKSVTNINENVTDMYQTFGSCSKLVNAPVIPNSVTNMAVTFHQCTNLVNAPVIPNNVTTMYGTFYWCPNLVNAPVIPNSVTNMTATFSYCTNLVNAPVIPNNVTEMYQTFYYCNNLVNAPVISNSVTNMTQTFYNCSNLIGDIYVYSLKISSAQYCFDGTSLAKNVYIPYNSSLGIYTNTYNSFNSAGYNTSVTKNGVTIKENPYFEVYDNKWWWDSYSNIIYKTIVDDSVVTVPNTINGKSVKFDMSSNPNFLNTILTNIDFNNTPIVGNMANLFSYFYLLTSVNNINYESEIYNMHQTFYYCNNLVNAPVIPNSVTEMSYTFGSCSKLVNAPVIPNSVTNMRSTFDGCYNLVNAPVIPNSVTNMLQTFYSCTNLVNAPVIPNSVTNIYRVFEGCSKLTGNIYIHSENIISAGRCFYATTLQKNVYIPFKYANNINTITYNSFISAGYKTDGSVNGVYLKDINTSVPADPLSGGSGN